MYNKYTAIHVKEKTLSVLTVLLITIFCFSPNANATESEHNEPKEVRVPITLEVPHAIAGAEFEIECTAGLKLISLEKSETIATAYTTPIVEKNGKTYFGFYQESNDYEPGNGVLDIGFLVFEHSEEPGQYILVTEAKYVQVIDKDNTNSEVLILNEKIDVPLPGEHQPDSESAPGLKIGQKPFTYWIIIIGAACFAALSGIILYKRKAKAKADKAEI
jgi:hypothetical protein